MALGPVTQPWTHEITLMQQAVLLECLRGPDGIEKYHPVKYLLRWYRRCVLLIAFPLADGRRILTNPTTQGGGSFTGPCMDVEVEDWEAAIGIWTDRYMERIDEMPLHFHTHFMHCAQVLGFRHPDKRIRYWWLFLYARFVSDMHLNAETEQQFASRLGDNEERWKATSDAATTR